MSKRRTYLHNAALLTGSGLVLRALGMGFRIVLAAYLGSEGMGLYQLILALYMVFVSFATAGVNVASARLAAQSLARGSGMAETLRGLCITALGFGTAAMLAQSVLAGPCARYLLHDVRAETALLILAPSLPFMAVSGAVRGCFLAARRVQPNITAQLIEQLVRMAVAAACRNAPFTSIVAQRRHKISPARQEFLHFRHFPRFKHCKPRKKQKILADFTKNLQTDIWQEGCRVFYGAEVQKTRPPGFPRRAQCGLWVFTSRSRPGPCGGSGGPPGRGDSWRG